MKGLVLIPAFDEGKRIGSLVERVRAVVPGTVVVVVDDGSQDDTAAAAQAAGATVLRHPFNLGYGAALQTGYKFALSQGVDWLVQLDADGQHPPEAIRPLLESIEANALDLVVGSRFVEEQGYRMGVLRSLGRRLFSAVAGLAGLEISDPTSGYQAMRCGVVQLFVEDFFPSDYPDVDVLVAAHRSGFRVGELPVVMSAGERPSTLHGGAVRSLYYVYKMLLSTWTTRARLERIGREPEDRRS